MGLSDVFALFQNPSFVGLAVVVITAAGIYIQKQSSPKVLKTLLDPDRKYALKLIKKEIISHDTR